MLRESRFDTDRPMTGLEVELNYNPNRNWRFKLAGAQQKSIDTNISPRVQEYINQRMPYWMAAKDDAGVEWWTSRIGSGGVPRDFYTGSPSVNLTLSGGQHNVVAGGGFVLRF